MKEVINFFVNLSLWIIAYLLTPIVELATLIVVIIKYGKGALNYFNGEAYSFDVRSASRNRSLWNWLFIKKNGNRFTKDFVASISWNLGVNSYIKGLTVAGWVMYYILYIIDFTNWLDWKLLFHLKKLKWKKGHCRECVSDDELEYFYEKYKIETNTN